MDIGDFSDIGRALALFRDVYDSERDANPSLPGSIIENNPKISQYLEKNSQNPGVAALEDGELVGFMVSGPDFAFKGQSAVIVPPFCHGAVGEDRADTYMRMYMALAGRWVAEGRHLHIMGHFASDPVLRDTLFLLGFGAVVSERVRGLGPVDAPGVHDIVRIEEPGVLVDLQVEHNRYYPESPVFIEKDTDRKGALEDLEEHVANDTVFACLEDGAYKGYMIVGEPTGNEGILLHGTGTAQIKSAYTVPAARGRGIGAGLLKSAVEWAGENDYERVFVEHESANYHGGRFWARHFDPYLHFSMRYLDNTL